MRTQLCEVCDQPIVVDDAGATPICPLCDNGGYCEACSRPEGHECPVREEWALQGIVSTVLVGEDLAGEVASISVQTGSVNVEAEPSVRISHYHPEGAYRSVLTAAEADLLASLLTEAAGRSRQEFNKRGGTT